MEQTQKSCVVVFRGSGFSGTHLLRHLVARGLERIVSFNLAEPVASVPGIDCVRVRERIAKFVRSTNFQPVRLGELGYEFETDLAGGLQKWAETSKRQFV